MHRADYTILHATPAVVLLTDNKTGTSVTNDAEAVVTDILSRQGSTPRIFYRDTDNQWGELKHDGAAFSGFAPMPADADPAIDEVFMASSTFHCDADLISQAKIIVPERHLR